MCECVCRAVSYVGTNRKILKNNLTERHYSNGLHCAQPTEIPGADVTDFGHRGPGKMTKRDGVFSRILVIEQWCQVSAPPTDVQFHSVTAYIA